MKYEIHHADELSSQTLAVLQELIRCTLDSCKVLCSSADTLENERLAGLLRDIAAERETAANNLKRIVIFNAEHAVESGDRREDRISSELTESAVLAELERTESRLVAAYDNAVGLCQGSQVGPALRKLYRQAQESRAALRAQTRRRYQVSTDSR